MILEVLKKKFKKKRQNAKILSKIGKKNKMEIIDFFVVIENISNLLLKSFFYKFCKK